MRAVHAEGSKAKLDPCSLGVPRAAPSAEEASQPAWCGTQGVWAPWGGLELWGSRAQLMPWEVAWSAQRSWGMEHPGPLGRGEGGCLGNRMYLSRGRRSYFSQVRGLMSRALGEDRP